MPRWFFSNTNYATRLRTRNWSAWMRALWERSPNAFSTDAVTSGRRHHSRSCNANRSSLCSSSIRTQCFLWSTRKYWARGKEPLSTQMRIATDHRKVHFVRALAGSGVGGFRQATAQSLLTSSWFIAVGPDWLCQKGFRDGPLLEPQKLHPVTTKQTMPMDCAHGFYHMPDVVFSCVS